ncbi:MAG: hypothetical protein KKA05_06725 [Alphaproteobacteria bacterium]|nr:hypothetical protein [Alphaproteobacteria bacterium]MBU0858502.1 hypothetical protein [Alphaproteobacteria bacterium]
MANREQEQRLYDAFNKAAGHFWDATSSFESAPQCLGVRGKLLDAADNMLLSRDALAGAELSQDRWDAITQDLADMSYYLGKHDIMLNGTPVQTSTGRTTYRILNKPRFDA